MQPATQLKQLDADILSLADYVHSLFPPTQAVEVMNILDVEYHFRYCVDEDVVTPDQYSRQVRGRRYDERTVAPGATEVLMGGAAFVFISEVANAYVQKHSGDEATGNIQLLAAAADKVLMGVVGYAKSATPVNKVDDGKQADKDHNPNAVAQGNGKLPPQPPKKTAVSDDDDEESAFGDLGKAAGTSRGFTGADGSNYMVKVTEQGTEYTKDGDIITQEEFEAADANPTA